MATNLKGLKSLLKKLDISSQEVEGEVLVFDVKTERYQNSDGEKTLTLALRPKNFHLFTFYPLLQIAAHHDALIHACLVIQSKARMIRFVFDAKIGELRCEVRFSLKGAKLTKSQLQLQRCISGMVESVDRFYPMVQRAAQEGEGVVEFEEVE